MGNENERKLYLQDPLLELRIPENEINFLTDLPGGLDYNEWLASHSKYFYVFLDFFFYNLCHTNKNLFFSYWIFQTHQSYLWNNF